jgi:hypothetical protein
MKPISHYQLTAELMSDEKGQFVSLEQQDPYSNGPVSIYADAWQLRVVLEGLGVVAADSNAAKAIATLERRLMVLCGRIAHLRDYLANQSGHGGAICYEVTYATATADLAYEFCHGIGKQVGNPVSTVAAAECSTAPAAVAKQQAIDF